MITLTRKDTQAKIELPDRLRWLDEYNWSQLAQASPQRTLGGAVVVQQGTKLAGRDVTLGNTENHDWIRKSTLDALREWSDIPELIMTLNYQSKQFDVCFRTHEQAISSSPVSWRHDESDDAWYHVELRLMTI